MANFNKFGQVYRVMSQASPEYRKDEFDLNRIFVRTSEGMAPVSLFATLHKVTGAEGANRFNLYSSIGVNIDVAEGYSTGEAMRAIEEVAKQTLPRGYSYEYGGIAREEAEQSGASTVMIYGLCIMLIGLLSKTAILITEYASERRRKGMGIVEAAYSAAIARFRPILMTVMTMVIGMLPLMFASGAGANGNRALGTGVVGGLLVGTIALVFVVPVFFIVFQWLQEKYVRGPKHVEVDAQTVAEHSRFLMDKENKNNEN